VAAPQAEAEAPVARQQQPRQQKVQQRKPKGAPVIKPEPVGMKRPRGEEPAWRKALKAVGLESSTNQAVAMCVALMLLIFIVLVAR
jgi:hypothetical protein